jgi:hypothetical protein
MEMKTLNLKIGMMTHKIEKVVVKIVMESIPLLSMFLSMRIILGDMDLGEMSLDISLWMMLTYQRIIFT